MKDLEIRIESVGDMEARIDLDTQDFLQFSFYPEIVIEAKAFDWPVEAQLLDAKVSALGQLAQDAIEAAEASEALAGQAQQAAQQAAQDAGGALLAAQQAENTAQQAIQEASGAVTQANGYTDQEVGKIIKWQPDGEGLIKPPAGVKVKEEHIQKEVRQIEVSITQVTATVEIDVTSLNLVEGEAFAIYANIIFVDALGNPGGSRPRLTINNITTPDYFYAALNDIRFQPDGSNSYVNNQVYQGILLGGVLFFSFSSNRVSITPIITSSTTNLTIRNNNIQQVNRITFAKSSADNYAPGTKFIIKKL